jgi:hypothetical protein
MRGLLICIIFAVVVLSACSTPATTITITATPPEVTITTTETPPILTSTPLPAITLPFADDVNLTLLDKESLRELENYWGDVNLPPQLPFNQYGVYASRLFYLQANESIKVTLVSRNLISCRDSLFDEAEFNGGIELKIERPNIDNQHNWLALSGKWIKSYNLKQFDLEWEATIIFNSEISGFYWLLLTNESGGSAWCQYGVTFISGNE